jgi:hypothetical protein
VTCFNAKTAKYDSKKTMLDVLGKKNFNPKIGGIFGQFATLDEKKNQLISVGDMIVYRTESLTQLTD